MKPLPYHEKNIEVGQQLCFGEIKKLDQFHPETCFSGKFEKARSLVIDFNPDSWSVFFWKKTTDCLYCVKTPLDLKTELIISLFNSKVNR